MQKKLLKQITSFFKTLFRGLLFITISVMFVEPIPAGHALAEETYNFPSLEISIESSIVESKPSFPTNDCYTYIEQKAIEYDLKPSLMKAIAGAESDCRNVPNWKYTDENGRYTAYGIFMITRTTWRSFCGNDDYNRMNPKKNIDCAMKIATKSGVHHWNESKSGWKSFQ